MPTDFRPSTSTVDVLRAPDLLLQWKEITDNLVACGVIEDLYQELDRRAGHRFPANGHVSASATAHPCYEAPSHAPLRANGSQLTTDDVETDRSTDKFASANEDAWSSLLADSDGENEIYGECILSRYLIDEAANLSQCKYSSFPNIFEELFAPEESFDRSHAGHAELDETPNCFRPDPETSLDSTLASPTLTPSEAEENRSTGPDRVAKDEFSLETEL